MPLALVTRREAANLSGITETTVKKAVDQNVIPARKRGSRTYIDVNDVPVLTMLGLLTDMRLPRKHKLEVRKWLRSGEATPELELTPVLVVRRAGEVDQAHRRAERYARLRDEWIVSVPGVKGGEPVIRGTRVSPHTVAARMADGESVRVLEEDFPHIPKEAREVAVEYARANPRRGRPKRAALER
jgi:uncharacterized protein (DUF433 family)